MERSTDARSPATSTDGKPTNLDSNQAAAASAQQPNTPSHKCTVPCTGQQIGQENGRRGGYNHRICPRPARRWPPFRRPLSHIISGLDLRKHDKSGQKAGQRNQGRKQGRNQGREIRAEKSGRPPHACRASATLLLFRHPLPTQSRAQTCANTTKIASSVDRIRCWAAPPPPADFFFSPFGMPWGAHCGPVSALSPRKMGAYPS
jgi:hypothetical protein